MGMLLVFFLLPYVVAHIGNDRYGTLAMVAVLIGYLGLLDFGVSESFVKYIAEFHAQKDHEKINDLVNTGFVFYCIFALVTIPAVWWGKDHALGFFHIPEELHSDAAFVLSVGVTSFLVCNVFCSFVAVQSGLQRMDIANVVAIVSSLLNAAGTVFCLENGYGVKGLVVNNAFIMFFGVAANTIIAFRIFPELKFNPFLNSGQIFKKMFGFGSKLQVTKIAQLVHFKTDNLWLAYFVNIGTVVYYEIPANLAFRVREIPLLLLSAIIPAASELDARNETEILRELFLRSMKYLALMALPLTLVVILTADPFITLWLGVGYRKSAITLQILMIGYCFNLLTGPGFFILVAGGKPQCGMKSSLLAAAINLALSVFLIIEIGYFGAAIGTAFSMTLGAVYFLLMFHKLKEISVRETIVKTMFRPFISSLVPAAGVYLLMRQVNVDSWGGLLKIGILYFVAFLVSILVFRVLDEFDRQLIKKHLHVDLFPWRQRVP